MSYYLNHKVERLAYQHAYNKAHKDQVSKYGRHYRTIGRQAWRCAMRLLCGKIVMNPHDHHAGMATLKTFFGDPRPFPSAQLSLIVFDGPNVYWGHDGTGRAYLLSRHVDDYAWETPAQNSARVVAHRAWKLEKRGW